MTAHADQLRDIGADLDRLTEKLHLFRAFHKHSAERPHSLISHEENRTLRPPQIMLQMMPDTSRLTHAGSGYDNLRRMLEVDRLGFVACNGKAKSRERNRIDPLSDQSHRLFVKTPCLIFMKNPGGLHRQRAVHIDREILVTFYQPLSLNLPQEIEHLLRPAHCKRRNHHIAATIKSGLQNLRQLSHIVHFLRGMQSVAVGGLHHHIIRFRRVFRVFDEGLFAVSDIAGKHQLPRHVPFRRPDLDAGRTEQMPNIRKADLYIFIYRHFTVIVAGDETPDRPVRVLHRIKRLHHRILGASLSLAVFPLCLLHLDMRTVTQHNAAQITGGRRRKNLTAESPRIQERQKTRMVYMRVSQEHIIYQRFLHRQLAVLKYVGTLLHAVVHQNILIAYPKIMAAPCHLMVCPDKHKLHTVPPCLRRLLFFCISYIITFFSERVNLFGDIFFRFSRTLPQVQSPGLNCYLILAFNIRFRSHTI